MKGKEKGSSSTRPTWELPGINIKMSFNELPELSRHSRKVEWRNCFERFSGKVEETLINFDRKLTKRKEIWILTRFWRFKKVSKVQRTFFSLKCWSASKQRRKLNKTFKNYDFKRILQILTSLNFQNFYRSFVKIFEVTRSQSLSKIFKIWCLREKQLKNLTKASKT